ncbi:EXTRA-LARGE G-PROTEIN-LIKE [Salix purpurea]|uniref:EXTRA-LARGE G-PROTEIN-LIKE n=1 Tax=Salix purpurea TaxID=77065 RepID=A0A9Q0YWD5_SALPP|nr:EXTRA-LARGE G-PROTEIN-LIKE [Salix purpurea]
MAEGSTKVRLVHCPKCENLLPELADYSVYQCGGCDAVLRAKKKVTVNGGIVEKSGMERDEEGFEILETLSEKEGGGLGNASETERESDEIINNRRKSKNP